VVAVVTRCFVITTTAVALTLASVWVRGCLHQCMTQERHQTVNARNATATTANAATTATANTAKPLAKLSLSLKLWMWLGPIIVKTVGQKHRILTQCCDHDLGSGGACC
jgi:hypothetical protein